MRAPFKAGDVLVIVRPKEGWKKQFPAGFMWTLQNENLDTYEEWHLEECRLATPDEAAILRLCGTPLGYYRPPSKGTER